MSNMAKIPLQPGTPMEFDLERPSKKSKFTGDNNDVSIPRLSLVV